MRKPESEFPSRIKRQEKSIAKFLAKVNAKQEKSRRRKLDYINKWKKEQRDKKRAARMQARFDLGDVYNNHWVILTCNNRQISVMGSSKWKLIGYEQFSELKNSNKVVFPKRYEKDKGTAIHPVKYELLLVESVDEEADTVSMVRNEYGKYIENEVKGRCVRIVDKCIYEMEDDFYVYGYHPIKERKDAQFIIDEILMKNYGEFTIKTVYIFFNKLIVRSDKRLDIIVCKNESDARRLYNTLLLKIDGNAYIFFRYSPLEWNSSVMDEVRELTGWDRRLLEKGNW